MKDILIRAFKTFLQAFLATLVVYFETGDIANTEMLKSAIVGALAAAISAVMNLIINLMKKETDIK